MSAADELKLKTTCQDIRAVGDVVKLSKQLDSQVAKIVRLVDVKDPSSNEDRIRELAFEATNTIDLLTVLAQPDWVKVVRNQRFVWEIDNDKIPHSSFSEFAKVTQVEIKQVILKGASHPEMIPQVKFEVGEAYEMVTFDFDVTKLFLCEMQNTFSIIARVRYQDLEVSTWRDFSLELNNPTAKELQ